MKHDFIGLIITQCQKPYNGLGSVRAEIAQNVAVNGSQSYAPYGEVFGASGTMSSPFAFTGEPLDGNGLQYHRARYYDPAMGVWANQDFLETSNRYGYASGNPINRVDLNGLQDTATATGIVILDNIWELAIEEALRNAPSYVSTADDIVPMVAEQVAVRTGISVSDDLLVVVAQRLSTPAMALRLNAVGLVVSGSIPKIQPNGLVGTDMQYLIGDQDVLWDNPEYWANLRIPTTPLEKIGIYYSGWFDTGTLCQMGTFTSTNTSTQTQLLMSPQQVGIGTNVSTATTTKTTNCNPEAFAIWWSTLPLPPDNILNLTQFHKESYQYENRVARNSADTFFGIYPKRIDLPRIAGNVNYLSIDVDGATRDTCRLVDAKHDSGGGGYTSSLVFIENKTVEEFRRYLWILAAYPLPVALEVRTNTSDAKANLERLAVQAGFTLNQNVFVTIHP